MTLDEVRSMTTNAECLVALDACRPDNPLNSPWKWTAAYHRCAERPEFTVEAINWLELMVAVERGLEVYCTLADSMTN